MNFSDVFLVVVLYKCSLEDSETIKTLQKNLNKKISLFVYDNSPVKQYEDNNFVFNQFEIEYLHDSENSGLSTAYNFALRKALAEGKNWLLLMDQDTFFTKEFIDEISTLNFKKISENVGAIIPKVFSVEKNIISPAKMMTGGLCKPINIEPGISLQPITGINSGTLIKTDLIQRIGGFNSLLPLDMLDHWYFREIYKLSKVVLVLETNIIQDLSVAGNFEETVSINRYKNILQAEKIFLKNDGLLAKIIFNLRLIRRALKQIKFKNKEYFKTTISCFFK